MFWMVLFLHHQAFVAAYRLCSAAGRVLVKAFVGGCLLVAAALLFSGFAMPYSMPLLFSPSNFSSFSPFFSFLFLFSRHCHSGWAALAAPPQKAAGCRVRVNGHLLELLYRSLHWDPRLLSGSRRMGRVRNAFCSCL